MSHPRAYPDRPFLAVSAVVERDGRIMVVRRARPPAQDRYTLPGGVVEAGETLIDAIRREVEEETAIDIEPIDIAAYREVIAGARWIEPGELAALPTTDGLAGIVARALERLKA